MTGFTEQLDATTEKYLAHFAKTAEGLKEICGEIGIPLDASGVNAVAFTTYKATKDAYGHMPTKAASAPPTEAAPEKPKAAPSGEKGRILKLENAGDEAHIAVAECAKVEGNFGPQYVFAGTLQPSGEAVRLFVGAAAVERQLEYLGLTAEAMAGKLVSFSRAPNPKGKPFWNIKPIKGAAPAKTFQDAPPPDDESFPF